MDANQKSFYKRLNHIDRSQSRQQSGFVSQVRRDGLVVTVPKRRGIDIPWKGLLLALAAGFVLKGAILANVGPGSYELRVSELAAGSAIERAGSWVMAADPLTVLIAKQIMPYIAK